MIPFSKENLEEHIRPHVKNNVYEAFKKVDRRLFVPEKWANYAYSDNAIPLNADSSISQPSLVVEMIDLLELRGKEHVLEVGTASGYSAAILSLCSQKVDTIEIDSDLARKAKEKLKSLGFNNITVHTGDGSKGFPSEAPFEAIVVTAATREIPKALIDQLKERGRIVIPIQIEGSDLQELVLGIKKNNFFVTKPITIVKFVPLVRSGK